MKMVLNIIKKKKWTSDVHLLSSTQNSVCFRPNNSSESFEINKKHEKSYDYPSLTWDTLKRKRRQNRQSLKPNKEDKSHDSGQYCEKYRSSPNLLLMQADTEKKKITPKKNTAITLKQTCM